MSATPNGIVQAIYASNPQPQSGSTTTADTSFTQPTETTVGIIATAINAVGGRIDQLLLKTLGTSVAGLARLWVRYGSIGIAIQTITFSTTTATVTTSSAHGLATGQRITLGGAFPANYNVKNVTITVTSTTTFTYTMATTPAVNAIAVGDYVVTPATPVYQLIGEVNITAVTGSTAASSWQAQFVTGQPSPYAGPVMPIILPAAGALAMTVSVTQTNALSAYAQLGGFA